ncbi:MAG: hypothetical protein Kow00129_13230 [Thermoleophilia bacterium]
MSRDLIRTPTFALRSKPAGKKEGAPIGGPFLSLVFFARTGLGRDRGGAQAGSGAFVALPSHPFFMHSTMLGTM